MLANGVTYAITWEKLPDDFVLDDEPVDNINQPLLAAALTESLEIAGKLPANALTTTNYWFRWWDEGGKLLLWGSELVTKERQRAERLAAQLRAAGIEPEEYC